MKWHEDLGFTAEKLDILFSDRAATEGFKNILKDAADSPAIRKIKGIVDVSDDDKEITAAVLKEFSPDEFTSLPADVKRNVVITCQLVLANEVHGLAKAVKLGLGDSEQQKMHDLFLQVFGNSVKVRMISDDETMYRGFQDTIEDIRFQNLLLRLKLTNDVSQELEYIFAPHGHVTFATAQKFFLQLTKEQKNIFRNGLVKIVQDALGESGVGGIQSLREDGIIIDEQKLQNVGNKLVQIAQRFSSEKLKLILTDNQYKEWLTLKGFADSFSTLGPEGFFKKFHENQKTPKVKSKLNPFSWFSR